MVLYQAGSFYRLLPLAFKGIFSGKEYRHENYDYNHTCNEHGSKAQ
jgi:hypothetical protein